MSLVTHLCIHVFFALVSGCISWFFFGNPEISFIAGFIGGVLIDLDHFIDYFIAFGLRFKTDYFIKGYQFLKNDKIYVLFHGWEYVILLLAFTISISGLTSLKSAIFALALGALFHLIADTHINKGMSYKGYSFIFRVMNRFEIKKIVTEEHYKEHLLEKRSAAYIVERI